MTILDLLDRDYVEALTFVSALRESGTASPHADAMRLERLISGHLDADRSLLHDALGRFPEAHGALDDAHVHEQRISSLLADLREQVSHPEEDRIGATLGELEAALAEDGRQERETVFPEAQRRLDAAELGRLFYAAERRRSHQSVDDSLIFPSRRFGVE